MVGPMVVVFRPCSSALIMPITSTSATSMLEPRFQHLATIGARLALIRQRVAELVVFPSIVPCDPSV